MKKRDIEFLYYMKGAMELYDDLPDGAWWAVGMEVVERFNKDHGRDLDPHDGFMHYVENAGNL